MSADSDVDQTMFSSIITDEARISEALSRSVEEVLPSLAELRNAMVSGRRLHFYMGIDPTADYVHIGHSTNYLVLRRLHALGHKITVLVGDFTAMIGDPSDKSSERVQLDRAKVESNLASFRAQIGKILDLDSESNPIDFRFNSEWLDHLTFRDTVSLASNFTAQQMLERDTFRRRILDNRPLHLHEFFYPLLQGYDSVALEVDAEVGGMDQKFNMLAGRTLLRRFKDKDKFVILTTLLVNPKTGEKLMSKSLGTGIGLNERPNEMFFKVMRLPDEGVMQCFVDCTLVSLSEIEEIRTSLERGENPRDVKLRLAREIVELYHGPRAAADASRSWLAQVSDGELPADMPSYELDGLDEIDLLQILQDVGRTTSRGEGRRLINGGAVRLNGVKVALERPSVKSGDVLQAGKKTAVRLVLGLDDGS